MTSVIVHRIRFDLKVGSRPRALRVQEIASRFVARTLPAILERAVAGLAADDRHLAFDHLDLQLGVLDERNFADELAARTARALADALFSARDPRDGAGSAPARETPIAWRRLELLADFLEWGVFDAPTDPSQPATPGALLAALIESGADMVAWLASRSRDRPEVLARLARQFPDETLGRLVDAISPRAGEAARAWSRELATRSGRAKGKRDAFWEAILAEALTRRAGDAELLAVLDRAERTFAEQLSGDRANALVPRLSSPAAVPDADEKAASVPDIAASPAEPGGTVAPRQQRDPSPRTTGAAPGGATGSGRPDGDVSTTTGGPSAPDPGRPAARDLSPPASVEPVRSRDWLASTVDVPPSAAIRTRGLTARPNARDSGGSESPQAEQNTSASRPASTPTPSPPSSSKPTAEAADASRDERQAAFRALAPPFASSTPRAFEPPTPSLQWNLSARATAPPPGSSPAPSVAVDPADGKAVSGQAAPGAPPPPAAQAARSAASPAGNSAAGREGQTSRPPKSPNAPEAADGEMAAAEAEFGALPPFAAQAALSAASQADNSAAGREALASIPPKSPNAFEAADDERSATEAAPDAPSQTTAQDLLSATTADVRTAEPSGLASRPPKSPNAPEAADGESSAAEAAPGLPPPSTAQAALSATTADVMTAGPRGLASRPPKSPNAREAADGESSAAEAAPGLPPPSTAQAALSATTADVMTAGPRGLASRPPKSPNAREAADGEISAAEAAPGALLPPTAQTTLSAPSPAYNSAAGRGGPASRPPKSPNAFEAADGEMSAVYAEPSAPSQPTAQAALSAASPADNSDAGRGGPASRPPKSPNAFEAADGEMSAVYAEPSAPSQPTAQTTLSAPSPTDNSDAGRGGPASRPPNSPNARGAADGERSAAEAAPGALPPPTAQTTLSAPSPTDNSDAGRGGPASRPPNSPNAFEAADSERSAVYAEPSATSQPTAQAALSAASPADNSDAGRGGPASRPPKSPNAREAADGEISDAAAELGAPPPPTARATLSAASPADNSDAGRGGLASRPPKSPNARKAADGERSAAEAALGLPPPPTAQALLSTASPADNSAAAGGSLASRPPKSPNAREAADGEISDAAAELGAPPPPTAQAALSAAIPAAGSSVGPYAEQSPSTAEPPPSPPISVGAAARAQGEQGARLDAFAASTASEADVLGQLRTGIDRQAVIQTILDRAPEDFASTLLRQLAPTHAGFIETLLRAIEAAEAPTGAMGRREALGFALIFALEHERTRFDAKRFVSAVGERMAARSASPPAEYLERIDRAARMRGATEDRYAPLIEIVAALRKSPAPLASRARPPSQRRPEQFPSSANDGRDDAGVEVSLRFIAHVVDHDDLPSPDDLGPRTSFAAALLESLEAQPARTLADLRRLDRARLARALVRYLPREGLERLAHRLAPGEGGRVPRFMSMADDRDAGSAAARWRIGFEVLLSERVPPRLDRFVETMRAALASPPTRAAADDEEALFGAPLALADDEPDPLPRLRRLLRYGARGGAPSWEATLDEALAHSPAAAKLLLEAAISAPLSRRNLTSQLPPAALQRVGRLVLGGESARALAFVGDPSRGAPVGAGSIAAAYDGLFRAWAASRPSVSLPKPIRKAPAGFEALGGRGGAAALQAGRPLVSPRSAAVRPPAPEGASIRVGNAGLALLHPYLSTLFARLGLLADGAFVGAQARARAVDALEFLAFGRVEAREHQLALDKVLCGIGLSDSLAAGDEIDRSARETCESLLQAFAGAWAPLRNSSIATIREAFLQRDGALTWSDEQWILKVATKPYDMLLDSMPWPFRRIRTRWMTSLLEVEWR